MLGFIFEMCFAESNFNILTGQLPVLIIDLNSAQEHYQVEDLPKICNRDL